MVSSRSSVQRPDLLEPCCVFFLRESRLGSLRFCWLAISAWLTQHQDELDIVLYDCIGFVWLSQKAGPILNFVTCVRDFVPEDRSEIVEAKTTGANDNIGMQRHHHVAAM